MVALAKPSFEADPTLQTTFSPVAPIPVVPSPPPPKQYLPLQDLAIAYRNTQLDPLPQGVVGTIIESDYETARQRLADLRILRNALNGAGIPGSPATGAGVLQSHFPALYNRYTNRLADIGREAYANELNADIAATEQELRTFSRPDVLATLPPPPPKPPDQGGPPKQKTPEEIAFETAKTNFLGEITPQIQERLNAAGILESGATPAALARALAQESRATSSAELDRVKQDLLQTYAPHVSLAAGQQQRGLDALVSATQAGTQNRLAELQDAFNQPVSPDLLAEILGIGGGAAIGSAALSRSMRRRRQPTFHDADLFPVSGGGVGTTLDAFRPGALPY